MRLLMSLTSIDDRLPLVLVLCPRLAIISTCCNPHADVDQREDVLVKQPVGRQILRLLSVREHIPRNGYELVQPFQVSKQACGEGGYERTR
jgi:hypothetical protein